MSVRDVIAAAAGAAGDSKTYIEDVFSTYLYTGNESTQTINNGIDLAGKGGLVWIKNRQYVHSNCLFDTVRTGLFGGTSALFTNETSAAGNSTVSGTVAGTSAFDSFLSTGFSLKNNGAVNFGSMVAWTFRKAPKFFDVVTYSGTGTPQTISHSLGQAPGMIIVKSTNNANNWAVWHRGLPSNDSFLLLNTNLAANSQNLYWNSTAPTSTGFTVGSKDSTNFAGTTYVAYLFAHDTTTDGLIQCGSYTGNGSATGPTITLGWEPQYLMIKNASGTGNWQIIDNMRGMPVGSADATLQANLANAESSVDYVSPTATGFQVTSTSSEVNTSGSTYIYMAIRRGPMRTPTDGTKVFSPTTNVTSVTTNFPVDSYWLGLKQGGGTFPRNRLTGGAPYLQTFSTASEASGTDVGFDSNTGLKYTASTNYINWNLQRAPGFFDVVCYTGTGSLTGVTHNLGVTPELKIIKRRSATSDWVVGGSIIGENGYLYLNTTAATTSSSNYWDGGDDSATKFSVRNTNSASDAAGSTYVAYLFASCPGVSKVGSYTGNGSSQTINCGFTNGARFVLIKSASSVGNWSVWDSARGITSGNDNELRINSTAAELTGYDDIDPVASGFIVNVAAADINTNGTTYIYLAIA